VIPAIAWSLLLFFSLSTALGVKSQDVNQYTNQDAIGTDVELARQKLSSIVWLSTLREHGLIPKVSNFNALQGKMNVNFGMDSMVSVNDSPPTDQDEPSIAANPNNHNNLVAGSHDMSLRFVDAAYYYSFNGGLNWTHVHRLPGTDAKPNAGDAVVAFDSNGNAYYSYIWGDFSRSDISIAVSKSTDGGIHWGSTHVVFQDPDGPGFLSKLWDKDWMEVDNWPGSPAMNAIYLTGTFFDPFDGHIIYTHSMDGGVTWEKPFEVSDPMLGDTDQLSSIASAPDGNVFVAWLDLQRDGFGGSDIVKVRRGDLMGHLGWQPIKTIQTITGLSNIGESRAASSPTIVVAPKPPGSNILDYNVYVAYAAIGGDGEPEIRIAVSTDKGNSWTIKKILDSNKVQEFFPALTGEPNGKVHLIAEAWSPTMTKYGIVQASTSDGGMTWTGGIVSDMAYSLPALSGSPSYMIGDYFDVDFSSDGRIHPIWTARMSGPENDILTDRGP